MGFADYLKQTGLEIEKQVGEILDQWVFGTRRVARDLERICEIFIDASSGGKRLRGTLVCFGYELSGQKSEKKILRAAAAFEIFQTAVLIHDDIIDQGLTRRGKPSVYRTLGGDHYGVSQALCLGDLGMFLANKLLIESDFDADSKVAAVSLFSEMVLNTILGEMLDVELSGGNIYEEKVVLTVHKLKSAYYTVVYPMLVGGVLGGIAGGVVSAVKEFGENLGVAFQIQDDILGVFGNQEELGKPVTSDIEEGKVTLLVAEALKKSSPLQERVLRKYYGKKGISTRGFAEVRRVFVETGSLDYSRLMARKYADRAKRVVPKVSQDKELQKLLFEMADFLVERTR